ncbi:MAG: SET domain-containing protein [Phycisphaerales bacterium]
MSTHVSVREGTGQLEQAKADAESDPLFEGWSTVFLDRSTHGVGVFAARDLQAGARLLPMSGPLVDFDTAVNLGPDQCYTMQVELSRVYIVLRAPGRYVNHSCDPNAGISPRGEGRSLELIALKPLRRGEEIRFDYSTTMLERFWTMTCGCGATNCRGVVADFDQLPAHQRLAYHIQGVVLPFLEPFVDVKRPAAI